MNDDQAPDRAEAASAYLDGELDVAERADLSADAAVMALVDAFARVRDGLGHIEPVPDDIRVAAVSAALAEFDSRQRVSAATPARVPASFTVTALRTRWRWQRAYRMLGGVAAAAVIAVVAVAALKSSTGQNEKTSSATEPLTALDAPAPRVEAAAGSSSPATAAPAGSSSQKAAAIVPVVNTAEDLARFATGFAAADAAMSASTSAGAATAATALVPTAAAPPAHCLTPTDTLLGQISVQGSPAFAVRDTSTGVVRAVDAGDCRVLFSAPPATP